MVSDVSYAELHAFAEQLGIPRRAFHGDHYDLHIDARVLAVSCGAVEVTSREVLMILRRTGLRMSPQQRRQLASDETHGSGISVSERGQ